MFELKKKGKVLTSKSVWTGPSSYEKRIYRAAVSQRLRNTAVHDVQYTFFIVSRSLLLIMRNVSDKFVEKIKTRSLCSIAVFLKWRRL